jgi:hypothetical protein
MSYTEINFKTKKALKECFLCGGPATDIYCYNPGLGPDLSNFTGRICLEGPHYPEPHKWYAEAELVNGRVVKIK